MNYALPHIDKGRLEKEDELLDFSCPPKLYHVDLDACSYACIIHDVMLLHNAY